jgi:hypothetical protein
MIFSPIFGDELAVPHRFVFLLADHKLDIPICFKKNAGSYLSVRFYQYVFGSLPPPLAELKGNIFKKPI